MEHLDFGARLWLAFVLPWRVLFGSSYAARIKNLDVLPAFEGEVSNSDSSASEGLGADSLAAPGAEGALVEVPDHEASVTEPEADTRAALQLLTILQREGRFIDFLQEEMGSFSDEEIGAAARVVHEGCQKALKEYVTLCPIREEEEGAAVRLEAGYNAAETRLSGKVAGEPPYSGTLAHHGWRVTEIHLPKLAVGHDAHVLAPAEVEL